MEQVDILQKTRRIFEKTGEIPEISVVDPDAIHVEIEGVNLASKLMEIDWKDLTKEEQSLRGFFTPDAIELFVVTSMSIKYVPAAIFILFNLMVS